MAFAPLGRAAAALLCATLLAVACDSPSDPDSREPAAIAVVAGGGQQGTAGQELAVPIAVKVTDDQGRPVAGQAVTFHVTAGGGTVFSGTGTTNAEGIAQERWTLGTTAGSAQTLEARVVNGSGATLTAVASATVAPGPVAHLERVRPLGFAVGAVDGMLDDTLVVRVTDAFGNGVAGVTVNWAATAGGGSTTAPTGVTDANGFARMTWVLGPPPSNGYQSASATVSGMTVSFYARAAVGMLALQPNGANLSAGVPVTASVAVNDFIGPVPGLTVHWQVTSGGGTVTPAASKTSDAGIATAQWTPGPTGGPQTLTATVGSLSATFTVNVAASGSRTLVATLPGAVLDGSGDRVLWVDASVAGPRQIKLRSVASGADVVVALDSSHTVNGLLFSGGALVWGGHEQLVEYRAGTQTPLGRISGSPSVEGDWAAWSSGTQVIRRNLATGTNNVVAGTGAHWVDAGANGDVAYIASSGAWLYHAGTTTPVSTQGIGSPTEIRTDGVNVVYLVRSISSNGAALWLDNGASDVFLAGHSTLSGGLVPHLVSGGWVAWSTGLSPTTRRTPGGTSQQVSPETTSTVIEALAPDGTVVYRHPGPSGRYYLVTPGGTRYDVGPAVPGGRIVVRDGEFFLLTTTQVYRLST